MLQSFHRYPGLTLGVMGAIGAVKIGAILWETTFTTWPLLHVLLLPLMGGGLVFGIGVGHDRLVSVPTARRLGIAGLLVSLIVAGESLFGSGLAASVWMALVPLGPALIGIALGRSPLLASLVSVRERNPSQQHVSSS